MDEEENLVLANGYWCRNCEIFEDEDGYAGNAYDGTCFQCGCSTDDHVTAEVVERKEDK